MPATAVDRCTKPQSLSAKLLAAYQDGRPTTALTRDQLPGRRAKATLDRFEGRYDWATAESMKFGRSTFEVVKGVAEGQGEGYDFFSKTGKYVGQKTEND